MRTRTLNLALALTGAAVLGGGAVWLFTAKHGSRAAESPLAKVTREAASNPKTADKTFERFIAENASNKDPKVQDQVGAARIRLAYHAANQGKWSEARAVFQKAEKEYKGTGTKASDFGGIPDQAAYQAAVCLIADHKEEEAKSELRAFLKDQALSPLFYAAHKRLKKLLGGQTTAEDDRLLQSALDKQQAHIRFETSVCGPKALAYLLPLLGKPTVDYKELAKVCGTTDKDGTTMDGMRKALHSYGITSLGYRLNRKDFEKLPTPALLLENDHYLVALKVENGRARVYDPRYGSEREYQLPPLDTPKFLISVLVFQTIETQP